MDYRWASKLSLPDILKIHSVPRPLLSSSPTLRHGALTLKKTKLYNGEGSTRLYQESAHSLNEPHMPTLVFTPHKDPIVERVLQKTEIESRVLVTGFCC